MATGGSVESIVIAGRRFSVDAEEDVTLMLGGMSNEIKPNGDNTARVIQKRVAWKLSSIKIMNDHLRGDHEYVQAIANGFSFVPCTIRMSDGTVYYGSGQVTGDIEGSSQDGTISIELSGPGALSQM